jgi:hypothetical protein
VDGPGYIEPIFPAEVVTMRHLTMAVAGMAFAAAIFADEAQPTSSYFEEAKLTVNERARADGFMRVRVIPENGTAREATLLIVKRMSENDLARGIATALNTVLGPDYVADKDAGEHVKIKKKTREAADFSVEVTFNAPGFAVILDN